MLAAENRMPDQVRLFDKVRFHVRTLSQAIEYSRGSDIRNLAHD